jgi:hypothetical protein
MPTKRKLDDITAELPSREALEMRIKPLFPSSFPPQLQLPSRLNMNSPYALFSPFISEDIFEFISQSTNEYVQRKQAGIGGESSASSCRTWKYTTVADIKVCFGILIYMGVHRSPCVGSYWRHGIQQGPLHSPRLYMSQKRFAQTKRFLLISRPPLDAANTQQPKNDKRWWYKLEPLAFSFERVAQQHYQPGSNIFVDETMIRCFGRTYHAIKMPNKPIKQGYKIFAIAEHGYIWTFTWSSRFWGTAELFRYPDLSPTGSMVLRMIQNS